MSLARLNDQELLTQTKRLVHAERQLLTKILQHLREVERRRLFSDLGYASLFEYAVKELAYSEGQAGRRIQAIRLIKEVPEVEEKIASGALSLSNISQAQSLFRELEKQSPGHILPKAEKISVLAKLQHKSAREGQRELLLLQPQAPVVPRRAKRVVGDLPQIAGAATQLAMTRSRYASRKVGASAGLARAACGGDVIGRAD